MLCTIGSCSERGAEASFVLGDRTFDMPSLAVDAVGKAAIHLGAVFGFGKLIGASAWVQRNNGGRDAEFVAAKTVVVFAVVGRIGKHAVEIHPRGRIANGVRELGRVVRRSTRYRGPGPQVGMRLAHDGEFGPIAAIEGLIALTVHKVRTGVTAFQAGGIYGGRRPLRS